MCKRLEILGGGSEKDEIYQNKVSGKRCCLCCLGLIFVVAIGAGAGACAYFLPREFSPERYYETLNEGNANVFIFENKTTCANGDALFTQFEGKRVFKCETSNMCVPIEYLCDGYFHCRTFHFNGSVDIDDRSDETSCDAFCGDALKYSINPIRFACKKDKEEKVNVTDYGFGPVEPPCYLLRYKCDGWTDCPNDKISDEDYPECPIASEQIHFRSGLTDNRVSCSRANSFICGDGLFCIPYSYRCNRFKDCLDQSDEVGC